jgi:hypothetical protein
MKKLIALIAAGFAVTAFAQAPAAPAKKEEKKAEAKPAAAAPAKKEEKKADAKK